MKIVDNLTDEIILSELGVRLAQRRIELQLTQAMLADKAGVSKSTVERVEKGFSAQMESMIRIFRVLNILDGMENMLPQSGPTPMDLLKRQGKQRQRASYSRRGKDAGRPWTWGENADRR